MKKNPFQPRLDIPGRTPCEEGKLWGGVFQPMFAGGQESSRKFAGGSFVNFRKISILYIYIYSSALSSYTLHFFLKGLSKILAVAPSIDGNPCMSPSSPCSARHATLLQSFLEAQDSRSSCFQTETAQKSEEQIEKTFHIHWKIEPTTP